MEAGDGGGFRWGGVEGRGEKAYNCNSITINFFFNFKKIKFKKTVISGPGIAKYIIY